MEEQKEPAKIKEISITADAKATVTIESPGGERDEFESSRNAVYLLEMIRKRVGESQDSLNHCVVTVVLRGKDPKTNEPMEEPLYEGTARQVIALLEQKIVRPQVAISILQRVVLQLLDVSDLRGLILTSLFGDAGVGGFGIVNRTVELEDGDVQTLVSASESQIDLFKEQMKKEGHSFDDGAIIMPGQSGFVPPPQGHEIPSRG